MSKPLAASQLNTLCFNDDAMKLIIDSATIQNSIKNKTLPMIDLHRLHPLINTSNMHSAQCLDFTAHKRNNLMCEHLTSSPMHIVPLGKENVNVFS